MNHDRMDRSARKLALQRSILSRLSSKLNSRVYSITPKSCTPNTGKYILFLKNEVLVRIFTHRIVRLFGEEYFFFIFGVQDLVTYS